MLGACPRLKTFVYEFNWSKEEHIPGELRTITKALVRIGASLENLWLDFTDSLYDNYADEHVPGHISSLSSLKELKNLKNLKIGLWPLFEGTDKDISEVPGTSDAESDLRSLAAILPVSLENIYFGRTRGKLWLIVLALTKLLRSKASFVPNLKEVSIEIFEIDMDDKASWWSDLADLEILAANVSVKVRKMTVGGNEQASRSRPTGPGVASCGQGVDGCLTWARPYTIAWKDDNWTGSTTCTLQQRAVSLVDG